LGFFVFFFFLVPNFLASSQSLGNFLQRITSFCFFCFWFVVVVVVVVLMWRQIDFIYCHKKDLLMFSVCLVCWKFSSVEEV
jgi:hypothetical protein